MYHRSPIPVTIGLALASYSLVAVLIASAQPTGSPEFSKLLADAKAEAYELKKDSEDLDAFTRSNLSWESHSAKVEQIKGHLNNAGKLLARMKQAEATSVPWQKDAIVKIESLLQELAQNLQGTINHLNENQARVHAPAFKEYVKANYEMATDLETLIRDFVAYDQAKEKFEHVASK